MKPVTVEGILKEFDSKFPIGCETWVLERHKDEVKAFLRSQLNALLESLKGEEEPISEKDLDLSANLNSEKPFEIFERIAKNQAVREFNKRLEKAKK